MSIKHKTLEVLHLDSDNVVHFGAADGVPTVVRGAQALVQKVIILLYTLTDTNYYEVGSGSDLSKIIYSGYRRGAEDELRIQFKSVFESVEQQIKEEQDGDDSLPAFERLRAIELLSVKYSQSDHSWYIGVKIKTEAGESIVINLEN